MSKVNILGVWVDDIDAGDLGRAIVNCVEQKRKMRFSYANVHAINIAQRNREFREFLNSSDILYCDGEGIRFGARILGAVPPFRTALTHWIWDLSGLLQEKHISVYLLGGQPDGIAEAANRLCDRYPRMKLVGYHHGFFDKSGIENDEVVELINVLKPSVLFVGFGMPDQEAWIKRNFTRLAVNAFLPCGGMIDSLAGEKIVAPEWMSENGMEWLHRFLQEPRRLWKRYLLGNPMFIFRIFLQRLTEGRQS